MARQHVTPPISPASCSGIENGQSTNRSSASFSVLISRVQIAASISTTHDPSPLPVWLAEIGKGVTGAQPDSFVDESGGPAFEVGSNQACPR